LDGLWESGFEDLKVEALYDGACIAHWKTVMHITSDASLFANLETVYLGILACRTKIACNVRGEVDSAKGKIVLYFPAASIIGPFRVVTGMQLTSTVQWECPPTPRPSCGAPRHPIRILLLCRSLLCYWGTHELRMTDVDLLRRLGLAQPTVSQAVIRGKKTAEELTLSSRAN
jgi:hypothetical protein